MAETTMIEDLIASDALIRLPKREIVVLAAPSIIGFTGTRAGMTGPQAATVARILYQRFGELHHGDCKGSDEQVHDIVTNIVHGYRTVAHPGFPPNDPSDDHQRAYCPADEIREPKEFLLRDDDIVDESEWLLATPLTYKQILRSGTWATIRRAQAAEKPVLTVWPNGMCEAI